MSAPRNTPEPDGLDVRSFHVVFALERRLHRIDRWRLPFPHGIPVRAIAYGAGALLAIVIASRLPLLGQLVATMPAPLRLVIAPAAIGAAISRLRVDGRPAHRYLLARVSHQLGPKRRSGMRPSPTPGAVLRVLDPVVLLPDESGPLYRPGRVIGPAELLLRYPAHGHQRGSRLHLAQDGGRPLRTPKRLTLATGQQLMIGPPAMDPA